MNAMFREVTIADLDAVWDIEQRAYPYPWSQKQIKESLDGEHKVCGLEQDGQLVAYCIWMAVLDEIHILNLAVDPKFQRQGLARQLFAALLEQGEKNGARNVFLEVRASNLPAQNLYESLGFCESGRRRNYYPAGAGREDAFLMGKSW